MVIDTYTFIRALADIENHRKVLNHLKAKCHIIVTTTGITKEYKSRLRKTGMTTYILQRRLEDLTQIKKLKRLKVTPLKKAKKKIKDEHLRLPEDRNDIKFIEAAVASKARYLITTDRGLLGLNPYKCKQAYIEVITPQKYVQNTLN